MVYVVCQKSGCQQTHELNALMKKYPTDESTKNLKCEKCGGVLTDEKGNGRLSSLPDVIPTITLEELDAQKRRSIKRKREEIEQAQRELEMLESDEDY